MTTNDTEYIDDAMEMMGKGYEHPAVVITPPTTEIAMGNEPGFIQTKIPAYVKVSTAFKGHMKPLKGAKLSVWLYIALSINDNGKAFPSIERIAEDTGYSNREVIDSIREIEALGYFTVQHRTGTSNLYRVVDFAAIGKDKKPTSEVTSGVKLLHPTSEVSSKTSEVTSLKPDINQILNQPTTTNATAKIFQTYEAEIGLITPHVRDTILDWLDSLHHPPEWIVESFGIAAAHNKRNLAYCGAILKRWAAEGKTSQVDKPKPAGPKYPNKPTFEEQLKAA